MDLLSLVARLTLDKTAFDKGLSEAQGSAQKSGTGFKEAFGNVAKTAAAAGAAITGAAASIYKIANDAAGATDRIDKMSQKIGLSRQTFQEMDFVMSQSGGNVESLQMAMKTLRNVMDNDAGSIEMFGVSVRDANGEFRSSEDIMMELISILQTWPDDVYKANAATLLFGRSGAELMPLLNGASGSLEEMRQQAHDLGLVLDDEAVDAGVHLTDTIDQVKRSFSSVMTQIGVKVMPVIQNLLDVILKNMPQIQTALTSIFSVLGDVVQYAVTAISNVAPKIQEFVGWLTSGSASAEAFKTVIIAVTAAFVAFKTAMAIKDVITNVITLIGSAKTAFTGLFTVLSANPIGIVVAAVAALIAIFTTLYNKCEWFRDAVNAVWGAIKTAVETVFGAIKSVVEGVIGFFVNAVDRIKGAWAGIGEWFGGIRNSINEKFANVREWFSEKFTNAKNAIQNAFANVGSWFQQRRRDIDNAFANMHTWFQEKGRSAWELMKGAFTDPRGTFERIKGGITGAFSNIDTWMGQKFGGAWTNIKKAFGNVKKWFSDLWSSIKGALKLPHFKINGSFSLSPLSVPHLAVDWYRKAYENPFIFSEPTVFGNMGFGDGPGSEIVYGRQNLLEDIASAMRSVMGAGFTQNLTINSPTALNPSEIARQTRNANRDMVLALRGV